MLNIFRGTKRDGGQIGIHRSDEGWAVAHISRRGADSKPQLDFCVYQPENHDAAFAVVTRSLQARKAPTISTLRPSQYNMLLVEAPDVAADELRTAVRWRIKDLIDFSVDEAVIDVFQMPKNARGGPTKMMYAIAARAESVRSEVENVTTSGLQLDAIEVLELSLRNLALLLDVDQRGVSLLYLGEHSGVLLLVKNGVLYLTRRIEVGMERLDNSPELRSELVAGLALEARRSLDYFESHYEQASIPILYTAGLNAADVEQLERELGASVGHIDLNNLFEGQIELSEQDQYRCLPAIGAALRDVMIV